MEAAQVNPAGIAKPHTHPLLLVAASSITMLSLAAVATLAGRLPGPGARAVDPLASVAPVAAAAAAPAAAPISMQQAVTFPPEKPKPAVTSRERAPASRRPAAQPAVAAIPASAVPAAPTFGVATQEPAYRVAAPVPAICSECGVVEAVREVAVEPRSSGGGAIAGGVVGGIIGNQIGKGSTRSIATILGAVGGAYAGNHIEKSVKETKRYDVIVRFEDGSTRTFGSETPPAWRTGDRVRLQNGALTADDNRFNGGYRVI